jgi:hypothetical protein
MDDEEIRVKPVTTDYPACTPQSCDVKTAHEKNILRDSCLLWPQPYRIYRKLTCRALLPHPECRYRSCAEDGVNRERDV